MATAMVRARSEAEMPVVTPSRASIETVKAVCMRASLVRDIEGKAELLDALAGQRQADQAAAVARHEVDRLRRRHLRRDDQVALVLAILVVDQDDHAAVADVLDDLLDRRQRRVEVGQRHVLQLGGFMIGHGYEPSRRRAT